MDVVGYSSLMQSDEAKALSALATIREVTTDQIKQYRGRIANTAGDSILAEFAQDAGVQVRIGVLAYVVEDIKDAAAFVGRALTLAPNMATSWFASGRLKLAQGEVETAIEHTTRAMRLSPLDTATYLWQTRIALAYFCAGRYDYAVVQAEYALRDQPTSGFALRVLSGGHAMAHHSEQSERAMARLRQYAPNFE